MSRGQHHFRREDIDALERCTEYPRMLAVCMANIGDDFVIDDGLMMPYVHHILRRETRREGYWVRSSCKQKKLVLCLIVKNADFYCEIFVT